MENKQSPSRKKLKSIQEEKNIREVNLGASPTRQTKNQLPIGLEILQKKPGSGSSSQKLIVSIKPRAPAIKTLYIREKNRYRSRKSSNKSGSRLAIGDHSYTTLKSSEHKTQSSKRISSGLIPVAASHSSSQANRPQTLHNIYNDKTRSPENCYMLTQPHKNIPLLDVNVASIYADKVDIGTLIVTLTSSDETIHPTNSTIAQLSNKIDRLKRKVVRQEMVFHALNADVTPMSSDEERRNNDTESHSGTEHAGCSYIQQYSHVPETSAFHRYAHQAVPLSPSKATTIEKEHNSEQYGRDFTTYDGITSRGRRHSASVPCKRNDAPKLAAERVLKIRHKLNPVRDYRLMDTVHYLAQGEFAPRDDGIKLTPSREAVLSDIIYEDVCRTHWPNTRLGRRAHNDRSNTRNELQRLIDNMLRERVAHVERRRRRHYRIVKLNHWHENSRPLGKTGDIIVASHKNKHGSDEDRDVSPDCVIESSRQHKEPQRRDIEMHQRRHSRFDDNPSPGPSHSKRPTSRRDSTYCYQQTTTNHECLTYDNSVICSKTYRKQDITSNSTLSEYKHKLSREIIKRDPKSCKQSQQELNLDSYILLPTLVVRTPSNVKRQKKFNELYHKILSVQTNDGKLKHPSTRKIIRRTSKKDMAVNINISSSGSDTQEANE